YQRAGDNWRRELSGRGIRRHWIKPGSLGAVRPAEVDVVQTRQYALRGPVVLDDDDLLVGRSRLESFVEAELYVFLHRIPVVLLRQVRGESTTTSVGCFLELSFANRIRAIVN